jgi:hypothetical protein
MKNGECNHYKKTANTQAHRDFIQKKYDSTNIKWDSSSNTWWVMLYRWEMVRDVVMWVQLAKEGDTRSKQTCVWPRKRWG